MGVWGITGTYSGSRLRTENRDTGMSDVNGSSIVRLSESTDCEKSTEIKIRT
jgi:hypothetical protein